MAQQGPLEDKLVVLIGGGGFVGTHLAQELLRRDARLRIAERHPEKAFNLRPLANLGQIQFTRCDVTHRPSLEAAIAGADAVVYLVGSFGRGQEALHATGAQIAAQAAAENGAQAFVYISALGADPASDSTYASTKGRGEELVRAAFPGATVLRPSILFGEDDNFINLFAGLIGGLPIVPVFGGDARLQPAWVDDAADAAANALADPRNHGGKTYELTGPEVLTMRELHIRIARAQGRDRRFLAMPDGLARLFAALPFTPMNADQWKLLRRGTVATGTLPGLAELGVAARPLDLFLDRWMIRYRRYGRFTQAASGTGTGAGTGA